ncbi:MAG: VCBS repeat-containing protein [Deltaproteobacteria bacterium]|nr:VCBS repeat-containing protein [Deltaproteobacteria bacterium]
MKHRLPIVLLAAVLLTTQSCSCEPTSGTAALGDACKRDRDCQSPLLCVEGVCAECADDLDCGGTNTCSGGLCQQVCDDPAEACEAGGSCCPGRGECLEGRCLPECLGTRCGAALELCCGAGTVCEAGLCMTDCGGAERCGVGLDLCCGAGEICYGTSCTPAFVPCNGPIDCPEDQICERDLGVCIDRTSVGTCEYHPPAGVFTPGADCRWSPAAGDLDPNRVDVVMTPVVGNLTDDTDDGLTNTFDLPDIAFVSYDRIGDGCCNTPGTLRIVDGRCNNDGTMRTLFATSTPALDNSGGLALGDLDGDGVPELVGILWNPASGNGRPQGTVAFRRTSANGAAWEVYWQNDTYPTFDVHQRGGAQPSIVNLDGRGGPEVVIGNVVLDGQTGALVWDGVVESGGTGGIGNNAFLGPVSTVADLDLDNENEVIAGNTVYHADGSVWWTYAYSTSNSSCGAQGALTCDGYNGVGNFDGDPEGEVVVVRQGEIFVFEHDGGLKWRQPIPVDDCPNNESGPPTVADFDGDGRPEIGTAAGDFYVVADLDCQAPPLPAGCQSPGVLWAVPNQDCSSRVTASSVFDFDGDGKAEVVYADETTFRIFDGTTGAVLFTDAAHRSHTRLEEPVIADVDNDGNAEVIIAENRTNSGAGQPGIIVWSDANDNWVFTRRIWNQHGYHVSNVGERGDIPQQETPNWTDPALNNFRQNVQGEGLFWAPDLVVLNLAASCDGDGTLHLAFEVMNQGSRIVPAGVPVTVYLEGTALFTLLTTTALIPGQREALTHDHPLDPAQRDTPLDLRVAADDGGGGTGVHNECTEDNNDAERQGFLCGGVIP